MWGTSISVPSITSYEMAASVFADTKDLRGRPGFKPLDKRSRHAKINIRKDGNTYILKMYNTDIIWYFADGSIRLNHGSWRTASTAAAITELSPFAVWCQKGEMVAMATYAHRYADPNTAKFVIPDAGLTFDKDLKPINPPTAYRKRKVVQKDRAKLVRKCFAAVPAMLWGYGGVHAGNPIENYQCPSRKVDAAIDITVPLTEAEATHVAMQFLPYHYEYRLGSYVYSAPTKSMMSTFWNTLYRQLDVYKVDRKPLPYGEV